MKKLTIIAVSTLIALVAHAEPTLELRKSPDAKAPIVGEIKKDSPVEISLDKWVFVKNLDTNKSGWVMKEALEKLTNRTFSYSQKIVYQSQEYQINQFKKRQEALKKLMEQQESLNSKFEHLLEINDALK